MIPDTLSGTLDTLATDVNGLIPAVAALTVAVALLVFVRVIIKRVLR